MKLCFDLLAFTGYLTDPHANSFFTQSKVKKLTRTKLQHNTISLMMVALIVNFTLIQTKCSDSICCTLTHKIFFNV